MDPALEQRAESLHGTVAEPVGRSLPFGGVDLDQPDLTDDFVLEQPAQGAEQWLVVVVLGHHDLTIGRGGRPSDLVDIRGGQERRFLDDHVTAATESSQGKTLVAVRRRRDQDGIRSCRGHRLGV